MFDKKGKKRTRNQEGTTWSISLVNVSCALQTVYIFFNVGRNWKFALIFSNIYGIWPSKYKSKAAAFYSCLVESRYFKYGSRIANECHRLNFIRSILKKFLNPFYWVFYLALPLHKAKWQNIAGSKKFFSRFLLELQRTLKKNYCKVFLTVSSQFSHRLQCANSNLVYLCMKMYEILQICFKQKI